MDFTIKTSEATTSLVVIKRIAGEKTSAAMAMTIETILETLIPIGEKFEKYRISVLEQYGQLNARTGNYDFLTPENRATAGKEIEKLQETPTSFVLPGKISVTRMAEEGIQLTSQEIYDLRWLLKTDNITTIFDAS